MQTWPVVVGVVEVVGEEGPAVGMSVKEAMWARAGDGISGEEEGDVWRCLAAGLLMRKEEILAGAGDGIVGKEEGDYGDGWWCLAAGQLMRKEGILAGAGDGIAGEDESDFGDGWRWRSRRGRRGWRPGPQQQSIVSGRWSADVACRRSGRRRRRKRAILS